MAIKWPLVNHIMPNRADQCSSARPACRGLLASSHVFFWEIETPETKHKIGKRPLVVYRDAYTKCFGNFHNHFKFAKTGYGNCYFCKLDDLLILIPSRSNYQPNQTGMRTKYTPLSKKVSLQPDPPHIKMQKQLLVYACVSFGCALCCF